MKKILSLWIFLHSLISAAFYFTVKACSYSFLALFSVLALTSSFTLNATEPPTENAEEQIIELDDTIYVGAFIGPGSISNKHTDEDGFANWGNSGASVNYEDTGTIGGILIGRQVKINGVPLRLELDGTFGDMSASTNTLDPQGLDETVESDILWFVTARAGLEKQLGPATVFASGGLAVARISNSVIDIDFGPNRPTQVDPDDSFSDNSIHLGWTFGIGAEVPLSDKTKLLRDEEGWTLRVEGTYTNFGKDTYTVNHSGGNSCGPGGPHRPCFYTIENEFSTIRVVVIRRFSL